MAAVRALITNNNNNLDKTDNTSINVTLRHVPATTLAVESNKYYIF
jgi:hypothetical protein